MQLRELRRYVEARGWTVAAEYADKVSGKQRNRPELDRLMVDARMHKFDAVAVWKLDRWARSLSHSLETIAQLTSYGVRWMSVTQSLDTDQDNAMSRAFIQLVGVFAELERSLIQERVQTGWKQYRADYAAGKRPASKSGKNLPIGRPKAIFDRDRVRKLRAEGKSWAEICAETGLPKTTVRRVAKEQ